ncbi:MAG: hypothetical protein AAF726_04300 [Planctomycetota bacterium]
MSTRHALGVAAITMTATAWWLARPHVGTPSFGSSEGRFVENSSPSHASRTVGEALAAYWGDRWTTVRPEVLRLGADLDAPLGLGRLIPWERALPEVENSLVGDGFPSDAFASSMSGITASEAATEEERDRYAHALSVTEELRSTLHVALDEGQLERAPLYGVWADGDENARRDPPGALVFTDTFDIGGWVVRVVFDSADFPSLDRAIRDVHAGRDRRGARPRDAGATD